MYHLEREAREANALSCLVFLFPPTVGRAARLRSLFLAVATNRPVVLLGASGRANGVGRSML